MKQMHKTTYTFVVLSEEPIHNAMEMSTVVAECDDGAYVAHTMTHKDEPVSPKRMATLLVQAGSDPSFFQLDDEGNEL